MKNEIKKLEEENESLENELELIQVEIDKLKEEQEDAQSTFGYGTIGQASWGVIGTPSITASPSLSSSTITANANNGYVIGTKGQSYGSFGIGPLGNSLGNGK